MYDIRYKFARTFKIKIRFARDQHFLSVFDLLKSTNITWLASHMTWYSPRNFDLKNVDLGQLEERLSDLFKLPWYDKKKKNIEVIKNNLIYLILFLVSFFV